jgi:multidrug efflux pump
MSKSSQKFNLSSWALANQQLISFMMLIVMTMGIMSYINLPRNEDPSFTIKKAVISSSWPGASIKDTTQFVTDTIEKKLQEIPYLDYIESYTRKGQSVVFINLLDKTPPSEVPHIWNQVRKKMKDLELSGTLPARATEPSVDDEFGDTYGTIYGFTTDGFSIRGLRDQVDKIRDKLLTVKDVSKVKVLGAQDEQIIVAFSPEKLSGLGLSLNNVINALQQQNSVTSAGTIRTDKERIALKVSGAFTSEDSLKKIELHINNRFIPLTEIAKISRQLVSPPSPEFRVNGKPAIGLAISMSETGNMQNFGEAIKQKIADIEKTLPYGISIHKVADQSDVVNKAVSGFVHVLVEAIIIVLGVSFISLGTRAGLVVAVSIPMVLAMTFVGMEIAGIGLQRISLGALIIALGLLVDDAMITVEAMISRLEHGWSRREAASYAFQSTAFPMLTGTLVMIAGFIPVGFASSSAGEYCYSMFVVVTIALMSSWIVAVVFSPLIGVWLLPKKIVHNTEKTSRLSQGHQKALSYSLKHPLWVIGIAVLLVGTSFWGARFLKHEFFPASDRPELLVDLRLPESATQDATKIRVEKLEHWLAKQTEVSHFSSYIGSGAVRFYLPMDVLLSRENIAELVVVSKTPEIKEQLKTKLNNYLERNDGDIISRVSPLELGPPVGWPVRYRITGPDVEKLRTYALQLSSVISKHQGTHGINLTSGEPERQVEINIDQTAARAVGLSSEEVANNLAIIFSGNTITSIRDRNRLVGVNVQGLPKDRKNIDTISNLQIPISNGKTVPLQQIASISYGISDPIIWRWNREPYVSVQLDTSGDKLPLTISKELASDIQFFAKTLPNNYHIEEDGLVTHSNKGNASVLAMLPVTFLFMLTLLMIQLKRFSRMILAVLTAPFGFIGVVLAMSPAGVPMGFVALLGVIALSGMIIRNSVILIAEVDRHTEEGLNIHDAIVTSTIHRARPILLTACAAILGMIPIAREVFWGPMAFAIIGGLLVGTIFTLTVLPAALNLLMNFEAKFKNVP